MAVNGNCPKVPDFANVAGRLWWIASYPKSGNTWTRILLSNYFSDSDQPIDLADLKGKPQAVSRQLIESWVGLESSDLTHDEIDRLRPAIYRRLSASLEGFQLCKVHDAWRRLPNGEGLFPPEATGGVIYIVRNPLDVCVSFAHHQVCSVAKMAETMQQADFSFHSAIDRIGNQLRQCIGSWSRHVASWIDDSGLPVHLLRYEDLHADPQTELVRVLEFIGQTPDLDRVALAVDFSSFDRVRAQEAESGYREKNPAAGAFFRRGQCGSWREELSPELVEKIRRDHAGMMARFGYIADRPPPAAKV